MDQEKLEKVYIPHLRGQLEQGQAVLFLGAGFSAEAKNVAGSALPVGSALTEAYWKFSYPDRPFEAGTSLQDLYEHAKTHHRRALVDVTQRLLTVEAASLPDWYKTVLALPWLRVYTLNIDNLTDAACRAFNMPRTCRSLSAISVKGATPPPDKNHLDVIHLNGTLADLPDNVTFSVTQYAERLAARDPWYSTLAADLLSRCVVFVGTKLDEPPLWSHVVLRGHRGGPGYGEMRHRSYLVTPTLPTARETLLSNFNVVWLPMSGKDFTEKVLSHATTVTDAGLKAIGAGLSTRSTGGPMTEVAALATSPLEKTEYLLGQEPRWSDIQSGRAITRQSEASLQRTVEEGLADKKKARVVVITGTAASGKSTALMRACLRLSAQGRRVAWIDRYSTQSPRDIVTGMSSASPPEVLAIDDADLYGAELASIVRDVMKASRQPLILLEVRSGRVDKVLNSTLMPGVAIDEIAMPALSDSDITGLLDVLERENRLGELRGRSRDDQIGIFKNLCGRELLVAMYTATTGQEFPKKVVDEWADLDEAARFIYASCALATAHRFGLTRDEIIIAIGDRSNAAMNELDKLVRRRLLIQVPGDLVAARHRFIARVLTDALIEQGQLSQIVVGLLVAVASKVTRTSPRGSREARMLRTFINHDFLKRSLSLVQARSVYAELESLVAWDYHYWLHRGALDLEHGDVSHAENFLAQAKAIGGHDINVTTEWAYLLFKKACAHSGALDAPDMIAEATKILEGVIGQDGSRSPYAYHVLGSQGLAWARRGIRSTDERARYLHSLVKIVDRGRERHPQDRKLAGLLEELKREHLMQAVPGHH